MSKKILSIVLAVAMLMSVLAVGSSAYTGKADIGEEITSYEKAVKWTLVCGSLAEDVIEDDFTDTLDEYLQKDSGILTRNLAFWDNDVINAYNNAKTEEDWEALYNLMRGEWVEAPDCDEEELVGVYPAKINNQNKPTMNIKYTADVENAEKGGYINVVISAKSNYYFNEFHAGIIYDKTKLTAISGALVDTQPAYWVRLGTGANLDFGIVGAKDYKNLYWPKALRENKNGEFDKYGIVKLSSKYDDTMFRAGTGPCARKLDDYTDMFTFKFQVKDTEAVKDGDVLDFFCLPDSYFKIEDYLFFIDAPTTVSTVVNAPRVLSASVTGYPFEISEYGISWTFENDSVTVGKPAPQGADYKAIDADLNEFAQIKDFEKDYTPASWAAYAAKIKEANGLSRDLTVESQGIIDALDQAIDGAKTALVKNTVVSATVVGEPVIGTDATVEVKVTGSPAIIRLSETGTDKTLTFDREDAEIIDNKDDTETWKVKVFAESESASYTAYAKYVNDFTEKGADVTIEAKAGLDLTIHSIVIPDMLPDTHNGGVIFKGKHDIIITTSQDVYKIQFVDGDIEAGCTYTYCETNTSGNTSYVDKGDERVWTIKHVFALGDWSMPIRTRAETTPFNTTGDNLRATVVY